MSRVVRIMNRLNGWRERSQSLNNLLSLESHVTSPLQREPFFFLTTSSELENAVWSQPLGWQYSCCLCLWPLPGPHRGGRSGGTRPATPRLLAHTQPTEDWVHTGEQAYRRTARKRERKGKRSHGRIGNIDSKAKVYMLFEETVIISRVHDQEEYQTVSPLTYRYMLAF